MAERRMFAKSITGSARFLRMPQTSRLLYYDLGMAADDDGIAEAFTVIRTTGSTEDDLRVLAARGFITVLNDDLVSYIRDWSTNVQVAEKSEDRTDRFFLPNDVGCAKILGNAQRGGGAVGRP